MKLEFGFDIEIGWLPKNCNTADLHRWGYEPEDPNHNVLHVMHRYIML
jgi:hypothetical protein